MHLMLNAVYKINSGLYNHDQILNTTSKFKEKTIVLSKDSNINSNLIFSMTKNHDDLENRNEYEKSAFSFDLCHIESVSGAFFADFLYKSSKSLKNAMSA